MQGYMATPDYYNDFIAHKDHKYISKHKGKNGKWIYVYNDRSEKKAYRDRYKQIKEGRDRAHTKYLYENQPNADLARVMARVHGYTSKYTKGEADFYLHDQHRKEQLKKIKNPKAKARGKWKH